MSSTEKFEYESETELIEDYKKLVLTKPNNLNIATEYLYESLVEEAVMGVAFQMHFESKYPVSLGESFIQTFASIFSSFFVET